LGRGREMFGYQSGRCALMTWRSLVLAKELRRRIPHGNEDRSESRGGRTLKSGPWGTRGALVLKEGLNHTGLRKRGWEGEKSASLGGGGW